MEEIKNKRISCELINTIVNKISERQKELNDMFLKYEEESKDYNDPRNTDFKRIVICSKPKLELSITTANQTETKEDVQWFVEQLTNNSKNVEKVTISFIALYRTNTSNNDYYKGQEAEESVYISLQNNYATIKFDYRNQDAKYDNMKNSIEALLNNAPESYDKTISARLSRENIPSLSLGLSIGLILTVALYLFCTFSDINIYINNFVLGKYFVIVTFAVSLVIGMIIPGKNHSLYRELNVKKKYVGYNSTRKAAMYKDDASEYLNNPEVEISKYYKNGKLRKQIEKNYSTAKIQVFILFVFFVAMYIVTTLV